MSRDTAPIPSDYLRTINAEAADGFQKLREAVRKAGPLDHMTCEMIMLAAFALQGYEDPFKIHARRVRKIGAPKETLQHAVLITFGATASLFGVTRALRWIDEIFREAAP